MPVTSDKAAPYAPAKTLLDIIERFRQRGIPLPINAESLGRVGVPETLLPRVIQSLKTLDLITDDGQPTPVFDGIRLASEDEYKKRLEDWLKATYADIFSFVDPKDGETRIRDAFRSYQPIGQQERMVTLFIGLCTAAGLIAEKPARGSASAPSFSPQARASADRIVRKMTRAQQRSTPADMAAASGLPSPLAGLLASLPKDGDGWTKPRRDAFVTAFNSVLDFCFPIEDHEPDDAEEAA